MMSSIVAASSVDGFFQEIVTSAIKARRVEATDGATHYLVSLLSDYTRPDGTAERTMDRPLTFLLDEALHTTDLGERFDRLRGLGDGVLYAMGFFGDHFEARGIAPSYLISIGSKAYGSAASILTTGSRPSLQSAEPTPMDLYGELARKFEAFVAVMSEVADATVAFGAKNSQGLVRAYERWLKTGSDRLADALSGHGILHRKGTLQ
jgi:hypothetical protein